MPVEHLAYEILGKILIIFSHTAVLASLVLYLFSEKKLHFLKYARSLFLLHSSTLFLSLLVLAFLIFSGYFEYAYVWKYTSPELNNWLKFSALWAGQEGSLLLWLFLQSLIGLIMIKTAAEYESTAMSYVALIQFLLLFLIQDFGIGSWFHGLSPFKLLKDLPENIGNPIFQNPAYLLQAAEGNGLNPLLQNFWMAIHPPILFAGYALCLPLFAYAFAAIGKASNLRWVTVIKPWNNAALFVLGMGLLTGGAWAYKALSFGGFWAWDPVENAALVPWILLLASLHSLKINYYQKSSAFTTFFLLFSTYIAVLYASYLTRSGILSEFSVHSFSSGKISLPLLLPLMFSTIIAIILLFKHYSSISTVQKKNISSAAFWAYVSVVVLLLSAFQIFFSTSIPVINRITGLNLGLPENTIGYFNFWQSLFVIALLILMIITSFNENISQKLRLKTTDTLAVLLGLVFGVFLLLIYGSLQTTNTLLFIFSAALFATSIYSFLAKKRKNKLTLIRHAGFALFIIGVVIAFDDVREIKTESGNSNIILHKQKQVKLSNNLIAKLDSVFQPLANKTVFRLIFTNANDTTEQFAVNPKIISDNKGRVVSEPDSRNTIKGDFFVYLTDYTLQPEANRIARIELAPNDTVSLDSFNVVMKHIKVNSTRDSLDINNIKLTAFLEITTASDKYDIQTSYTTKDGKLVDVNDSLSVWKGIRFSFNDLNNESEKIVIELYKDIPEKAVIKIRFYPYIWMLWFGAIVFLSTFLIAAFEKPKQPK